MEDAAMAPPGTSQPAHGPQANPASPMLQEAPDQGRGWLRLAPLRACLELHCGETAGSQAAERARGPRVEGRGPALDRHVLGARPRPAQSPGERDPPPRRRDGTKARDGRRPRGYLLGAGQPKPAVAP